MTSHTLRVLLWNWGRKGAGPRYALQMAEALDSRDDVSLSLSYSLQSDQVEAMRALGLPSLEVDTFDGIPTALARSATLPSVRRRFKDFLKTNEVDIVYCTMMHPWDRFMIPAIQAVGASHVVTVHERRRDLGFPSSVLQRMADREILHADGVVVLTDHVKNDLDRRLNGLSPTVVIPLAAFHFPGPTRQSGGDSDILRVLFLGRIVPYKGLALLLEAIELIDSLSDSRIELTIAGAGSLEPYSASLSHLPGTRVINEWLTEQQISDLLRQADVIAVPYVDASQSGVIATAFGAGIPVVVTPVGGLVEQVTHGETGLVSSSLQARDFATALLQLRDDPDLRHAMSARVVALARDDLSWAKSASDLVSFLQAVRATSD